MSLIRRKTAAAPLGAANRHARRIPLKEAASIIGCGDKLIRTRRVGWHDDPETGERIKGFTLIRLTDAPNAPIVIPSDEIDEFLSEQLSQARKIARHAAGVL